MLCLKKLLIAESQQLERIITRCDEVLMTVPEGSLRISIDGKYVRYYHKTKENPRAYITKDDENLPRLLAQKNYSEKVQRLATKRKRQIDCILKDYDEDEIEKIFTSLHVERRKLVNPVEKTWNQLVQCWEQKSCAGKGFSEDSGTIYTEKGERVRSKSEKILADYFARNNIPYKYEKSINLDGFGLVYPDFTILSKKTRREVIWEHFGLMDDPAYAESAVKKINAYMRNGIMLGERLIATFETKKK